MLTADALLAGAEVTYVVAVPSEVLNPGGSVDAALADAGPEQVRLRPLRVADLQRAARAAKDNDQLMATLMVQQALVEPELSVAQAATLHVGLVRFLLAEVNRISGIAADEAALSRVSEEPLARAAFVLAREYGWTPKEVNELTLGQVLLHLKMLKEAT